ncbi:MAG: SRPBCC domain-containing protein [Paracoccaceae bacterium]|nr:MAG: SRPBCC domain-containing protein [Paracoccaceae bacterium]
MPDILHRVGIRSAVPAVFGALATRDGVAGWWTEETSGDDSAGGRLRVRFTDRGIEIGAMEMAVLEHRPDTLVLWEVVAGPEEWIGTRIRFDLKQEGDHCVVLFRHEGWAEPGEFMHHCSTKWGVFMMSLKALVETGTGLPSPRDIKIDNWN